MADSAYRELCNEMMELLINVGLMATVIPQMPDHVQENWDEKIEMMRSQVRQQTEEVQAFGEAFDEPSDDES